jgi:DNA polymerase V
LTHCSLVHYIFFLPSQFHTVVQYDTPDQGTPAVLEGSNDVRARSGGAEFLDVLRLSGMPGACLSRLSFPRADDYLDGSLDLNQHLIKHPTTTFFVRVAGESMREAGIHSGDVLIVDRALTPGDGSVIIAIVNGELTVKRLSKRQGKLLLMPENQQYPPLPITEMTAFEVWGVVTYVIHRV